MSVLIDRLVDRFIPNVELPADRGRSIQTFSGPMFWPLDPRADEVRIEDIAHSLSMQARYNGHGARFYSVAEHSIHISIAAQTRSAERGAGAEEAAEAGLCGLLHDGSEAYVSDVVTPVKRMVPAFESFEDKIAAAIAERFGLVLPMPAIVHELDKRIVADERAALMKPGFATWHDAAPVEPLGIRIACLSPAVAEALFLARYRELIAVRRAASIDRAVRDSNVAWYVHDAALDGCSLETFWLVSGPGWARVIRRRFAERATP